MSKFTDLLSDLKAILEKYSDELETVPVPETDENTLHLSAAEYQTGMSDMPAHAGEYYFLAPKSLTGNINSIFVGNIFYKYERIYTTGQELWYGKHDVGDVLIETKDGKKYSTAVQGDTGSTGKLIMDVPYFAVTNGTRPTWYAFKPMASFPSKFRLVVQGHIDVIVSNNGTRWEGNGWIVKQSDVVGRGMAVVGPNKQSDGAKALVYEV